MRVRACVCSHTSNTSPEPERNPQTSMTHDPIAARYCKSTLLLTDLIVVQIEDSRSTSTTNTIHPIINHRHLSTLPTKYEAVERRPLFLTPPRTSVCFQDRDRNRKQSQSPNHTRKNKKKKKHAFL
ncbi:hypothetical protein PVAG01_09637 [Phlyctema vagabunda]|uniref:Uncharacterized protein n=1 Tax=Phlyctema vagabunda TaxID=108571 RepID=A0ABR4P7Z7_9HELO